jgi:hypothetical protein
MLNQEMKFRLLEVATGPVPNEGNDRPLITRRLVTSGGGKITITEKGLQLLDSLRDELDQSQDDF